MPAPDFLRQALRGSGRRFELVHVESGAVLASRVSLGRGERRLLRPRWPGQQPAPGKETAIVVTPSRSLHTFFAPSPIDAAFLGHDGTILATRREMKPWRVAVAFGAHAVIEAAPGFLERSDLQIGDRVALREAQAARPVREVAHAREGFQEVPDSVRAAVRDAFADAIRDVDAEADPWDVGTVDAPLSPMAAECLRARSGGSAIAGGARRNPGACGDSAAGQGGSRTTRERSRRPTGRRQGVQTDRSGPRRHPGAVGRAPDADGVVRGRVHRAGAVRVLLDGAPAGRPGVPEAEEVAITPEGGVELLADGSRDAPVARVARLLHGIVEGTALPVQLRLLVLQELSPSPGCASVLEFSTRLALFERPGRENLIRGVYERFTRLPPREDESLAAATQPAQTRPVEPPAWWRTRAARGAAAAALLVVALGLVAAWVRSSVAPPAPGEVDQRGPVARDVAAAVDSVSEAATGSARAVAQWLGVAATDRPSAAPPSDALETAAPSALEPPTGRRVADSHRRHRPRRPANRAAACRRTRRCPIRRCIPRPTPRWRRLHSCERGCRSSRAWCPRRRASGG